MSTTLIACPADTPKLTTTLDDSSSLLHGSSPVTNNLRAQLRSIAPYLRIALISGEPGVGKHRAARELHRLSHPDGPFLSYRPATTCSDSSNPLVASTPQAVERIWTELFEAARGGTLVVEKPGNLSAADQAALLQLLRERSRRGSALPPPKIVGISREPSRRLWSSGRLGHELHSLFSAVEICVRPLRERVADIDELASELLTEVTAELRIARPQLSSEALALLKEISWRGNVAELRSVLHKTLQRESQPVLVPASFEVTSTLASGADPARSSMRLQDAVEEHVAKVLALCDGNKLKTAELLGVSRSTLYRMLETMPTVTR